MHISNNDTVNKFRSEIFRLYINLGLIISLPMAVMYNYVGLDIVAAASAAYFISFVIVYFWIQKYKTLDMRAVRFLLVCSVLLMLIAHYQGNELIDNKPWPVLLPILAMSLTGPKEGALWSVFMMITLSITTAITPNDYEAFSILLQQAAIATTTVIFFHFVKHNDNSMKLISELSQIDSLTQIYNRHYFNLTFDNEVRRSYRNNSQFVILMLDVDYFKSFNDLYGHQQGDKVLAQIAQTLKDNLRRPGDFIYRYGGEEFCILLTDTGHQDATKYANNLLKSIYDLNISHDGSSFKRVTASIGMVHSINHDKKFSYNLLNLADKALYKAKEHGRNQIVEDNR